MESNMCNYELVRCLLDLACLSVSHFPYADKLYIFILFDIFIRRGNADIHATISPVVFFFVFVFLYFNHVVLFYYAYVFTHINTYVRTHIYLYSHLHIHRYRETLELYKITTIIHVVCYMYLFVI